MLVIFFLLVLIAALFLTFFLVLLTAFVSHGLAPFSILYYCSEDYAGKYLRIPALPASLFTLMGRDQSGACVFLNIGHCPPKEFHVEI
jgi:hypothetical protein